MQPDPLPEPRCLTLFALNDLRDYLVRTAQVTRADWDTFRRWWVMLGDVTTGLCPNSIRYVPLGYWGWTDPPIETGEVERQIEPTGADGASPSSDECTAHRVLCALEQFRAPAGTPYAGALRVFID